MKKTMKRIAKLGVKAASIVKGEVKKELNMLAKKGVISKKQIIALEKKIVAEGKTEARKFASFVKNELIKEAKKAKPILKELRECGKRAMKMAKPMLKKVARKAASIARKGAKKARKAAKRARRKKR